MLYSTGTNIVTETYRLGTLRFWSGIDPYALPLLGGDRYEYSPFFCLLYSFFAFLPSKAQALAWSLASCLIFWLGIVLWWDKFGRIWNKRIAIAIALAAMELNICLLYQQINASIVGATLIGLWYYSERNLLRSGLLLTLVTNTKPIPGLFPILLLLRREPKFFLALAVGSVFALVVPFFFLGWTENVAMHLQWVFRLIDTMGLVRPPQLDLGSVLGELVGQSVATPLTFACFALSIVLLIWGSLREKLDWACWISLALSFLLLASPRTESPTFVLIAPAYLFLAYRLNGIKTFRWISIGLNLSYVLAGFMITVHFTDLWPRAWQLPFTIKYYSKVLGTLLIWLLSTVLFFFKNTQYSVPHGLFQRKIR